jgi:hypothetical protein
VKPTVIHRRQVAWSAPPGQLAVIGTGPLGYLGAADEDRTRWLGGFRRLLDGVQEPLQVVMSFRPGAGTHKQESAQIGRAADLQFAQELGAEPTAQQRGVCLVVAPTVAQLVCEALRQLGVPGITCRLIQRSSVQLVGTERRDSFADREGWHRTWWLDRLPGFDLEPGWLLRLVPRALRVTVAIHAEPLPAAWVVDYLQRQLRFMRASQMTGQGGEDPALYTAMPNAETLQKRVAANQENAFQVSTYVTVTSLDETALEAASEVVEAAAQACLVSLHRCTLRMRDGRIASLPLGLDRLRRQRVLDTSSLSTFFPWLDADLRQERGVLVGTSRATGCPVLLDPFDDSRFANANIGVFGHSGAGKTYLLSSLALSALGLGTQVFIIDPEQEYLGLAERAGGVAVSLALGSDHALNVLELRPVGKHLSEAWMGPAAADAVDLTSVICGGLDEAERVQVEQAVRGAYEAAPQPVLAHVAQRLPPESRAGRVLSRWVKGALGAMFSSPTNVDLDAPVVAFGMRELREEMVAPVHFLLAEALWSRIKTRDRRRLLVVDELGLLFDDPTIRRFVVNLARRIRKYDGALVFATQNPGDLLSSEAGAVVATNPAILFLGAQRPGEAQKLQRAFQLSDDQRTGLEMARRGEFLLAAAGERLPIKVRAAPWQERLIKGADWPRAQ